jgi:hypothetical protein
MARDREKSCRDDRIMVDTSRVPANGSFNNVSRGSGCAGVRTVSTISYT